MKRTVLRRKTGLKRKTPLKRASKRPAAKLDKELWVSLSFAIRERDNWTCYTCGKKVDKTDYKARMVMHAGHWISRRINATRFDTRNVNSQCYGCNINRYGQGARYSQRIIQDYGLDTFNELIANSKISKQWTPKELTHLIDILKNDGLKAFQVEHDKLINEAKQQAPNK